MSGNSAPLGTIGQYFKSILEFAEIHTFTSLPVPDNKLFADRSQLESLQLKATDLEKIFCQPFSQLSNLDSDVSKNPVKPLFEKPVNQLRTCIEILRTYLNSGLLATWSFEEGQGTETKDASGKFIATLNGPTWVSGRTNKGLCFDGQNDYLYVKNSDAFVVTDAFTICAWIYPTGAGSGVGANGGGIILNKYDEYEIARFPDGSIQWAVANDQPGWVWNNTGYIAPLNQWTHIALVYNQGQVQTYANGDLVHTLAGQGNIKKNVNLQDLRIGGRQSVQQYFQGTIDEIRIYSKALSPRAIAQLAGKQVSITAHWKFDEGEGSVAQDASDHGYTGTLNGPEWQTGRVDGGSTLWFDGVNDNVTLQFDNQLKQVVNNFTIAFWVYPYQKTTHGNWRVTITHVNESPVGTPGTAGQRYAWSPLQGNSAFGSSDHAGVGISVGSNGVQIFEHSDAYLPALLVYPETEITKPEDFPIQSWTHITVVYQNLQPRLYINGQLVKTGIKSSKKYVHALPEAIGGGHYGYYQGSMDDVRIYNGVLGDDDIAALAFTRISSTQPLPEALTESDYLFTTYETLLRQIGTSYDELRLLRGSSSLSAKALAERLGIGDPTLLGDLLLTPNTLTEAKLEELFGFPVSAHHLLDQNQPLDELESSLILAYQREYLEAQWKEKDKANSLPIIDPDIIGQPDIQGATASSLWQQRVAWLQSTYSQFKQKIKQDISNGKASKECFDGLLLDGLGSNHDLGGLFAKQAEGDDISEALQKLGLSVSAFQRLTYVSQFSNAGTVKDSEWEDVVHILVQSQKLCQKYGQWHQEEQQNQIILSSKHFVIGAPRPNLQPWRATAYQRQKWEQRLQTRKDQQQSLYDNLQKAVAVTDEQTLPILRDTIISQRASQLGLHPEDMKGWLTQRLQVDFGGSGSQQTTRLQQAIESLQSILMSVRSKLFGPGHPAARWSLAYIQPNGGSYSAKLCDDAHFEEEWKWIKNYEGWRGAISTFQLPENLLMPSLREDKSEEFKALLEELRNHFPLSPKAAREAADLYQKKVNQQGDLPNLTDEYTDDELKKLQGICKDKVAPSQTTGIPVKLQEFFYFVPMEVALQLQKSHEYAAALKWFARVYAYHFPENQRKIYTPLALETNQAPYFQSSDHWLIDFLDPHYTVSYVARTHQGTGSVPNFYTRFTLISLIRCLIEYGDVEFTIDTGESLARARNLYLTAQSLLSLPDLDPPVQLIPEAKVLTNPVLDMLRQQSETQLTKLRQGRNIAGMKRQVEILISRPISGSMPTIGAGGQLVVSGARPNLPPTPYKFSVLLERSKQLVNIAQQIESNYLSTLEKLDAANYGLFQAEQGLSLAREEETLQGARYEVAKKNTKLAQLQGDRVPILQNTYQIWIAQDLNVYENNMLTELDNLRKAQDETSDAQLLLGITSSYFSLDWLHDIGTSLTTTYSHYKDNPSYSFGSYKNEPNMRINLAAQAIALANRNIQENSLRASFERKKQEWQLQIALAEKDQEITDKQHEIAQDNEEIARKEKAISATRVAQAEAIAQFLACKFTNADLYDWMSRVLGDVYKFFLQQATAIAQLAQNQLLFERQETSPPFIQADYWQPPTSEGAQSTDRKGLTGSARLLEDIYKLDQYAFETNKRKLNLSQTFSLAQLFPYEFQLFLESGVLPFRTPMQLFDEGFPGHYLRLIKQVRTSVIALIPPNRGIRATLTASGISRVVTPGDMFQEIVIHRDPELVALTSPINATGVFEMDAQSDMLFPFEGMGVDTTWEFQMPRAANPFDFRTIADILITIDYTALHSQQYRQQVVQTLDPSVSSDRGFSIRNSFPDIWYDLNNPDQAHDPFEIEFSTKRGDFPSNLVGDIKIQELLFYVQPTDTSKPVIGKVELTFTPEGATAITKEAAFNDSVVSTRRTSGNTAWNAFRDVLATGSWKFKLSDDPAGGAAKLSDRFRNGEIADILIVLTFSGRKPAWP